MAVVWQDFTLLRQDDVRHRDVQVLRFVDLVRPHDLRAGTDERDHAAGAARADRGRDLRQGTDVDAWQGGTP